MTIERELDVTKIYLGPVRLLSGPGFPEGVVAAPPGSLYQTTTGGVFVKGNGIGTTGWVELAARNPLSSPVLLGRGTSGPGPQEEIILGAGLAMTGTVLSAIGGGAGAGMNLDYLGDYAPGTYNDGDIVIGPDGIAYLCVVDGTTTPPEPWPGVGVAINAAVDATYWTVTPHSTLVNERALSALANGYVKSTAGEPSTVAIIPVADGGTGANNANTARTNLGVGTVGTLNTNGNPSAFLSGTGEWAYPPYPTGVPSGLIAIFFTACPPGWTRVIGFDGYFLRGGPAYGPWGGSSTHSHGAGSLAAGSHTHGVGSYAGPNHNHGGSVHVDISISGNTGGGGDHAHTVSASGSGTTGGNDGGSMNVDAGGSGVMARSPHGHGFSVDVNGNTSNHGGHTHPFGGSGGGDGSIGNDGGQSISGVSGPASAGVSGATDVVNHLPPYIDVVFCEKN